MSISIASALSRGILSPIPGICFILAIILWDRAVVKTVLKAMLFITVFTLLVMLPMTIYGYLFMDTHVKTTLQQLVIDTIAPLLLRVSVATGSLVLLLNFIGYVNLIRGLALLGTPRNIVFMLALLMRFIPVMLRDTLRILAAREARIISRGTSYKHVWGLISTVAGDILARSSNRAWRMQLALKAKGIDNTLITHRAERPNVTSIVFLVVSLSCAASIAILSVV